MENLLICYFNDRFHKNQIQHQKEGPILTISREFGCPSGILADELITRLNLHPHIKKNHHQWKCVNKEILERSAKELHIDKEKAKLVFKPEHKSTIEEIILSFLEKNYSNEIKIKKTISEVISQIAGQGYVIIVGRGGLAFTQHIKSSLHIKLQAPLEIRAKWISEKYAISKDDAVKKAILIDKERNSIIDYFLGYKGDASVFDAIFNCNTFSVEQMTDSIIRLMEVKKLI